MSYVRERLVPGSLVLAAALSAALLAVEARRGRPPRAWPELSAGLGTGARAGVATGWLAFDPRLEAARDDARGRVEPSRGASPQGVRGTEPLAGSPARAADPGRAGGAR